MNVTVHPPYLLFLGDSDDPINAKTARGVYEWRPETCLAELAATDPGDPRSPTLGLPRMSPEEAAAAGARTLVVGTVSAGGVLPDSWVSTLLRAVDAGLDVASGLHRRLRDIESLRARAEERGRRLIDIRYPTLALRVGTGERRPGKRILTVGTDCSVGKMYTALALERGLRARGVDAHFKATGQTGILIAGGGVPVDAVVSDFVSGSVEDLSPAAPGEWHLIEGQGSLHHPAYAGVTLGLIHGSQPDYLVVCHEPTRAHMRHVPGRPLPALERTVAAAIEAAQLTNPEVRCLGFSINTSRLDAAAGERYLRELESMHRLPATDPVRFGVEPLLRRLESLQPEIAPRLSASR